MRLFMGDLADDRIMIILPVCHDDPGFLPHPAPPSVGGHQQRSGKLLAIVEHYIDAVLLPIAGRNLCRQVHGNAIIGLNRFEQQPAKHGIFDHDAHRGFVLAR